jgi:hypothetical protein
VSDKPQTIYKNTCAAMGQTGYHTYWKPSKTRK